MPGEYEKQVDSEKPDDVKPAKEGKVDEEDPDSRAERIEHQASTGNVADDTAVYIPSKTHYLMLFFLITTLICLLAIVPSRSLGTGMYQRSSAGFWDFCTVDQQGDQLCATPTATGNGPRVFGGVMSIMAILLTTGMVALEAMEFMKPGRFSFFLKAICGMHHVLWIFLLISWACWAGWRNNFNAALDDKKDQGAALHQYYAWGFIFLIFMWIFHMFLALLWTMKIVKKGVFFGF